MPVGAQDKPVAEALVRDAGRERGRHVVGLVRRGVAVRERRLLRPRQELGQRGRRGLRRRVLRGRARLDDLQRSGARVAADRVRVHHRRPRDAAGAVEEQRRRRRARHRDRRHSGDRGGVAVSQRVAKRRDPDLRPPSVRVGPARRRLGEHRDAALGGLDDVDAHARCAEVHAEADAGAQRRCRRGHERTRRAHRTRPTRRRTARETQRRRAVPRANATAARREDATGCLSCLSASTPACRSRTRAARRRVARSTLQAVALTRER
mmetsp:Transcript_36277/g.112259  ORF Transcript_36277/g.112259 Transcript_36277/m.112259 type:complete len:265 (+) Transcript_36277:853-1647(+)